MAGDGSLWYCRQGVDFAENSGTIRRIVYTGVLGVERATSGAITFAMPYPSPETGVVDLAYTLPARATVELSIFDLAGRSVIALEPRGERAAGAHRIRWDGRSADGRRVHSGVYLARLSWDGGSSTHRLVIAY